MHFNSLTFEWVAEHPDEVRTCQRLNQNEWARETVAGIRVMGPFDPRTSINERVGTVITVWNERYIYQGQGRTNHLYHFIILRPEAAMPEVPDLDVASILDNQTPGLPPFKILYDTVEEARLRLTQTILMLKGRPFLVDLAGGSNDKILLVVSDSAGKKHKILLNDIPDFRACPPRYITYDSHAYYLCRIPARVSQQGMTSNNTYAKMVGTANLGPVNRHSLLKSLEDKKVLPWNETVDGLLRDGHVRDLRLSTEVSVYRNKAKLFVEYRGRDVGPLKEDTVTPDFSDDGHCRWITRAMTDVSLKVRHAR